MVDDSVKSVDAATEIAYLKNMLLKLASSIDVVLSKDVTVCYLDTQGGGSILVRCSLNSFLDLRVATKVVLDTYGGDKVE